MKAVVSDRSTRKTPEYLGSFFKIARSAFVGKISKAGK
jgi:hypothetical protein